MKDRVYIYETRIQEFKCIYVTLEEDIDWHYGFSSKIPKGWLNFSARVGGGTFWYNACSNVEIRGHSRDHVNSSIDICSLC